MYTFVNGKRDSTCWTPARGDVVSWPFIWRHPQSTEGHRFAGVFRLDNGPELALVAFSNIGKLYPNKTPVDFEWSHKGGEVRSSRLYKEGIEVNLVPLTVVGAMLDEDEKPLLRGWMDEGTTRLIEKMAFGTLLAGRRKSVLGARWVAPHE